MRPRDLGFLIALAWVSCGAAGAADPARIEWNKDTLSLVEQGAGKNPEHRGAVSTHVGAQGGGLVRG